MVERFGEASAVKDETKQTVIVDPNSERAARLLWSDGGGEAESVELIYARDQTRKQVSEIKMTFPGDSVKVLHAAELLIGNQNADVGFYTSVCEQIDAMSDDEKPDVAVLSGLLQGDFKYLEKSRRATIVSELTSMDEQFRYALQMVEKLQATGVPVVYNMGNDDRRIAEEYTIEVFRKMQEYARGQEGINWAKIDKMRQHPEWNTHYQFQINEVFPYCLRLGRRLYTADEMYKKTEGRIAVEEYFLLFDEYMLGNLKAKADGLKDAAKNDPKVSEERMKTMRQIREIRARHIDEYKEWLLLSRIEQNNELEITDDLNLKLKTNGKEYTDYIRHYLGFSATPMYQNHMVSQVSIGAQLASGGHEAPSMIVTQNNHEAVGVGDGNSWNIATGGMIRAIDFINTKGSRADAKGDISRRLASTRRRIPQPTATIHERTDDDRHIVTIFNDALNEKSWSIPERMTIAELCDWQTGSITARPDLLAKELDYIRTKVMGERATAIFFGGDMMHGRNYPHFPAESQQTGLMAMDSQEEFNIDLMHKSFGDLSREELAALTRVLIQPGNHEWNSGTLKWHGYSFLKGIESFFREEFARAGVDRNAIDDIVKRHEAFITQRGEYATGYTGIEYFGELGVLIQHYLMDRGGKGSGGDLPVYQTHHFANGAADLMSKIDVFMAGHWHHPQYGVFGNKVGIVGGSIAGISDYELKRGYRAAISGTLMHIGGGKPMQVEFLSEKTLHAHTIESGRLSAMTLKAEGYRDDRGFDAVRHGIMLPDSFPKSALQKKVRQMMRDASQRESRIATFR